MQCRRAWTLLLAAFAALFAFREVPAASTAQAPALRVVRAARTTSLLQNGDFERKTGALASGWRPFGRGYRLVAGEGRDGSAAIALANAGDVKEQGASQEIALNRTAAAPLVVRGWSRSEGVSGSADSGYSLYVDLTYADGTPLYGQAVPFRCGTHGWELRELFITPPKPVRSLTLYCLFRGHTGKVWFDDLTLVEQRPAPGVAVLQGVPVKAVAMARPAAVGLQRVLQTRDGLRLTMTGGAVTSVRVEDREVASSAPSGFLARDASLNSDFYPFEQGTCPALRLKLDGHYESRPDHVAVSGRVTDTSGRDRAVTLLFALPIAAEGWRWEDDIRRSRTIAGADEYSNVVAVRCGSTGTLSLYPLAAIHDDRSGLAIAIDMAQPAQYRLAYHAGTRQLFIAYDFGLVRDTRDFPSSAGFRFVVYRFDPRWGFRSAFDKLTRIFPDQFRLRSRQQGVWMPFTDVSTVQGWHDFGFRYHEGDNNVPWDDAHGILSFRYTEPMTWWMPMPAGEPRTLPEALSRRNELARGRDEFQHRMAEASRSATMVDEDGNPGLKFIDAPWCDGAVWSLNPNPRLPGDPNGATVHWNNAIEQKLYGPGAVGQLDGEYLDSLEGYVTIDLNYSRDQFRFSTVPLTFDTLTKRPAIQKGLAVFEFERWLAGEVHRIGRLMFANSVPSRYSFLCPSLDVLGTETNWLVGARYHPPDDATACLWRTMSGRKPYLLLMNTNFDRFTPDLVQRYFQRSLFYGFYPGMFSHNAADSPYWQNPAWYNRDRPLFKKYQPLIRQIAEAGWQPVTRARCDNPAIHVERFGPAASGTVYLTLLNDSDRRQSGTLRVDTAALRIPPGARAREMIGGHPLALSASRLIVSLPPGTVSALRFARQTVELRRLETGEG